MAHAVLTRLVRLPMLVIALTLVAIAAAWWLESHADASRQAQLQVSSLKLTLTELVAAPFNTIPDAPSVSRGIALSKIHADEVVLSRALSNGSRVQASSASLMAARSDLTSVKRTVAAIMTLTGHRVDAPTVRRVRALQTHLATTSRGLFTVLERIDQRDARRGRAAQIEAALGTALAMLLLLGVFLTFYARAVRAKRENEALLTASRIEASTDALTSLGNRRALLEGLTHVMSQVEHGEVLLALFDLNGFKQFNDTFGHGAGDALLARLGERLAMAVAPGAAFRLGGDEFCVLARCPPDAAESLLDAALSALAENGDGWSIDCAHGATWIPSEAATASDALKIADQRMYANKTPRSRAWQPTTGNSIVA